MTEQLWWYVARSGGIVALLLAAASVIWGLLFSTKVMVGKPSPKWLLSLHRFLGGSTIVFTAIHVAALVADDYVTFGLTDILVPLASSWKPGPVAWGIVAMYLLIAVQATSLLMKRLPRRLWKWVHLSSYLMLWTGLLHGATAGTDAGHPVYVGGTVAVVGLTSWLTAYRILTQRKLRRTVAVAARARS